MANKNTVNRRVNLYINGKEISNDIKSVRAEMQKLINEQAKMKIGSDEYVSHAKRIRELRGVMDEHNRQLQVTSKNWFSMGRAVDGFNKYSGVVIGMLGSLTGVVLGFRKCADEAGKFEENLDNLSALTGLEGKSLDWLGEQAKEMSVKTTESGIKIKQSATDILDAFTKVGSQRPELLKNKEALAAVTEDAIILSEAAKMKLEPATASLANVMNQFNAKSSESRRIINELAAGSQAGSGDIQYLSDAVEKCGTSAYLMGMKTNETIGVIEAVAPKFKEASMAGNSLDKMLLKMKEQQIGYKSGIFNINDALDELQTRFARGESSMDLFGVEHAKMAEVLVMAKDDVIRYTAAVTGTDKALEQAAKNTNNRVTERAQAMNKLKLKMIEVGEQIAPAITIGTNSFTYFLNALVKAPKFYEENKRLIFALIAAFIALQGKTILATAATLQSRAAHVLDAAAKMKSAVATAYMNTRTEQYNQTQGRLHPALLKARTGFVMLGRAMMANPIGAVILAFTALKEAIQFYDRNNATSIKLENKKKTVINDLNMEVGVLSETYKKYQEQVSTLNRLSVAEKKDLREKIDLTIEQTEAELANYKVKQLQVQRDNERIGVWDTMWTTMTTYRNPFTKDLGMGQIYDALTAKMKENGKAAAEEMVPGLEKLEESLANLKQQGKGLDEILSAEINADKIGTGSITELQEKVNLYRVALENAGVKSEEYERIQKKLTDTQKQLNKAVADGSIREKDDTDGDLIKKKEKELDLIQKEPARTREAIVAKNLKIQVIKQELEELRKLGLEDERLAEKKQQAEVKLAAALTDIRNKLQVENMSESEKEIFQMHQKYAELLSISQKYGLDATEVMETYQQELKQIFSDAIADEVTATVEADERINGALMSGSEREKAEIKKKYADLLTLAEQNGLDTEELRKRINGKMEQDLNAADKPSGLEKMLGLSDDDLAKIQEKITMAVDMCGQLSDIWGQFNQIAANRDKKELQDYEKSCNNKKELLNKQLNSGRISQEKYNAQVAQLDADLEKKKTEMARKQAKRDKAQSIFSTMINTASAIVQALNGPWPASLVFAALAGVMGAAQLGVIMSTPLPEYAAGGKTAGAQVYIAGEAGQEWISPNWMLQDPVTGPIIEQLELVRSGTLSPKALMPVIPDFQTMTKVPMYAGGGYTGTKTIETNYYTTNTAEKSPDDSFAEMNNNIRALCGYLSDPKNRQVRISNDLLQKNNEEMNEMNRLKRL